MTNKLKKKRLAKITYSLIREVRNGQFGKRFLSKGGHVTACHNTRWISTGTHWVHVHYKVTERSITGKPVNRSLCSSSLMTYL